MKKLIDTIENITDFINGDEMGIFQTIYDIDSNLENPQLPWLDDSLSFIVDIEYYTVHSADKNISKQFGRYIGYANDNIIGVSPLVPLATIIINKFKDKWNKLYDAVINSTYKPLDNYNMKQKETPNTTRTKNVNVKTIVENDVYGFNSSSPVPSSKSETTGDKLQNEESETHTGYTELERSGNIGVTTSQQMLQSEIDLRSNYNFINDIMKDVDSILCLLVY